VFTEAKSPIHAPAAAVHALLAPVLALVTDSQKQIAQHRQCLLSAQQEDGSTDGDLERLHQTLDAWEREVKTLLDAARRVRLSALQYARYATEIEGRCAVADIVPVAIPVEPLP
jgi:hypothetical protein